MSWNSVSATVVLSASVLRGPQQSCSTIEHRVDELVAVGGTEALGERHRLVDRYAIRHLLSGAELVQPDQQNGMLDGVEQARFAIAASGQPLIESLALARHPFEQRAEVLLIGARHVFRRSELLHQVLPRTVVQLPAVERLQRELARHAAGAAVGAGSGCVHRPAVLTAAP